MHTVQKSESPAATGLIAKQSTDTAIIGAATDDSKRFATLAAKYALAGHGLIRCTPADGTTPYAAVRWGLIKPLADLDAAEEFLNQIGGQP